MTTKDFKQAAGKIVKADGARMVDFNLVMETMANIIAIRNHGVHRYTAYINEYVDGEPVVEVYYEGVCLLRK